MLTTANSFDSMAILDGIRRWAIADADELVPKILNVKSRSVGSDGKGAHTHYEQMYISSIEPRARLLHRLYQTLR